MKLSDVNPHIRYAAVHHRHVNASFDSVCYDCRLFFIKEGAGRVIANECEYAFSGNTALFFPAGTKYHFYPDKGSTRFVCIVVNFDLVNDFSHISSSLGTASAEDFKPERMIPCPAEGEFSSVICRSLPAAESPLEKCCDEFLLQNPLYREVSSALVKLCLIDLVRSPDSSSASDKMLPIIEHLHANYADPTLTNETLARLFSYHPNYLSQMIRRHLGQSLHQYLISYRIKMAKRMLITTDDPINTIAWKTGFNSPAYFAAQFRAKVGVSPNTYRKDHFHFLL